jgi:cytidylate kinase
LQERDKRDRSRLAAPLRPANDAIILDTSAVGVDAVMNMAISHIAACSD